MNAFDKSPLERRREQIIQWRSQRLGITPDEAQSQLEARRQGRGAPGRLAADLLTDEEIASLEDLTYPTAECLEGDEVERYVAGDLAADRREHAESCEFCKTVVDIARPSEEETREFLREVAEFSQQAGLTADDLSENGDDWDGYEDIKGADDSDDSRDDLGKRGKGGLAAVGSLAMAGAGGGLLSVLLLVVAGMKLGFMSFQRGAPKIESTDFASENYSQLSDLLVGHPTAVDEQVKGITVSPDRSRMAFVKEDGSVVLWDPSARQEVAEIGGPDKAASRVDFQGDGSLFMSTYEGELRKYDQHGKLLETLPGAANEAMLRDSPSADGSREAKAAE